MSLNEQKSTKQNAREQTQRSIWLTEKEEDNPRLRFLYERGGFVWKENLCYLDALLNLCLGPWYPVLKLEAPRFAKLWHACQTHPDFFRECWIVILGVQRGEMDDPLRIWDMMCDWCHVEATTDEEQVQDDHLFALISKALADNRSYPDILHALEQTYMFQQLRHDFRREQQKKNKTLCTEAPKSMWRILTSVSPAPSVHNHVMCFPALVWNYNHQLECKFAPSLPIERIDPSTVFGFTVEFPYTSQYIPALEQSVADQITRLGIPLVSKPSDPTRRSTTTTTYAYRCVGSILFRKNHYTTLMWNRRQQTYIYMDDMHTRRFLRSVLLSSTWNAKNYVVRLLFFTLDA